MSAPAEPAQSLLVDADVHPDFGDLIEYLPRVWHERWQRILTGAGSVHEGNPRGVARRDAQPPSGGPPASGPEYVVSDHLERYGIDCAILAGPGFLPVGPGADDAKAVASAYNDCQLGQWLPVTARF